MGTTDRYLLESGAPDGYALEDGSGVFLLDPLNYRNAVIADGAIAYWRLGETSGTVAATEVGLATGTYTNTPTLGVTGAIGSDPDKAVTFTRAQTEYVDISNMPAAGASGVSVEAWIKTAANPPVGGNFDILDWLPSPQTTGLFQLQLSYDGDRFLTWSFWDGTTFRSRGQPADYAFTVGSWFHIVITHNYAGQAIVCYINGVSVTFQQPTTTAVAPAAGVHTSIGKWWGSDTNPFDGSLDEVAVYPTVLTATQVANHYAFAKINPTLLALPLATFAPVIGSTIVGASPTALSLATFAPAIGGGVVPPLLALTLSTFAPTVTASDYKTATPPVVALSLATFAPTFGLVIVGASPTALALTTFAPVIRTTIVGASPTALSLSTFAPTVSATAHQVATPGLIALILATFAPAVTASDHQTATPTPVVLSLSTFSPTITASDHKLVTPPVAALTLSTFAPTGMAGDPKLVTPGLVTLALATFAPSAFVAVRVTPDVLALTLSGLAPTLVLPITVTPDVLALTLETFEPVAFVPDPVVVTLGLLELVLSGLAPMPNIGHPMSPSFIAGVDMVPVATASVSVVESPAVTVAFDEQEVSVTWAT